MFVTFFTVFVGGPSLEGLFVPLPLCIRPCRPTHHGPALGQHLFTVTTDYEFLSDGLRIGVRVAPTAPVTKLRTLPRDRALLFPPTCSLRPEHCLGGTDPTPGRV